ncbi:MAG: hypothetical protein KAX73_00905 [Aquabacterium sp.]|nr:hypothetical protein [Aquabacterium sp.]
MPIAAVAGAVFAGVEIATVGIAAMSTFEIIAAVGAITSGVGALTGNEDLMKLGGVAALAGGVGAFASGKGWLGGADAAKSGTEAVSNTEAMINSTGVGVENVTPTVDIGAEIGASSATSGGTAGLSDTAANITAPSSAATPSTGLIDAMNPTDIRLANGTQTTPFMTPASSAVAPAAQSGTFMDTIKGFADLFKDKDGKYNKDMLSMGMNFVGGLFDDKKGAETDYLKAQIAAMDAQRSNASAIPDMSGLKVSTKNIFKSTAPTYLAPRVGGLMNAKA